MPHKLNLNGYIASRAFNTPLLLEPAKASVISEYLQARLAQDWMPADPSQDPKPEDNTEVVQQVAVIPIVGTLVHRGGWMDAESGMLSYQTLRAQLIAAANDTKIKAILLDIDSGGGEVEGNFELARLIREIDSNHKPVVALANGQAFSGAFSLGVSAGQFFMTPTGGVGSVGVIMQHVDVSKNNEMRGVKVTNITSGAHKADFSSDFPLSESARETLQKEVDRTANMFISLVSEMRGISEEIVRGTEAALLFGQEAVNINFVDGMVSFDDLLETMVGSNFVSSNAEKQRMQTMNFLKKKAEADKPAEEQVDPAKVEGEAAVDPAPAAEPAKEADPAPATAEVDPLELAAEIADICSKAGMSHMASGFIKSKLTVEEVKEKVDMNKQIEQICKLAGKPELAKGYIDSGKPLGEIQSELISKLSAAQTDVSNTQSTDDVAKSVTTAKNVIMEDIERRNANKTK